MSDDNNEDIRETARKRLHAKAGFRNYIFLWIGISIVTTVIYFLTNPGGFFWPGWVIVGMGIAAFFQALAIWGPGRKVISESAIDAEVRKLNGEK